MLPKREEKAEEMTNSAEAVLTSVILSYLVAWADAPLRAEALAASVVGADSEALVASAEVWAAEAVPVEAGNTTCTLFFLFKYL
ncbi:hypothetical protein CCAN12_710064 [Capnocytophaga canimorsus]|uniref:Uncharacterized protein n=1 Tax=Capnocytophaga canimorsus TaxID=28188 RepID=A0A0B7HF37_9FLAO|nr:hypothetical protein CCAN12_710064 [Capnocytophaga canimorsus]